MDESGAAAMVWDICSDGKGFSSGITSLFPCNYIFVYLSFYLVWLVVLLQFFPHQKESVSLVFSIVCYLYLYLLSFSLSFYLLSFSMLLQSLPYTGLVVVFTGDVLFVKSFRLCGHFLAG